MNAEPPAVANPSDDRSLTTVGVAEALASLNAPLQNPIVQQVDQHDGDGEMEGGDVMDVQRVDQHDGDGEMEGDDEIEEDEVDKNEGYNYYTSIPCTSISIATNTGWVFNTHFLLYFIHNCMVLRTNKRYCAQRAHSDTARESRYIIQRSIRESWIVVKFVTLILINSIAHMRQRCFHIDYIYDVTRKVVFVSFSSDSIHPPRTHITHHNNSRRSRPIYHNNLIFLKN
jgi:hypothetical protein